MNSEDNPNIVKRFLNWFFPKKLYDPFDKKNYEPEPKYIKKDNNECSEKKELEERLKKLRMIIKKNKSVENSEDEIDLT